MQTTHVKDLMTPNPVIISSDFTLKEAGKKMEELDCGILPVGEGNNVSGIITDRDIVIRAVSKGKDPSTEKVANYMTKEVFFCNDNDTLKDAADVMREHQVSRLLVKNEEGNLTGILSFGCILRKDADIEEITEVVEHAVDQQHQRKAG